MWRIQSFVSKETCQNQDDYTATLWGEGILFYVGWDKLAGLVLAPDWGLLLTPLIPTGHTFNQILPSGLTSCRQKCLKIKLVPKCAHYYAEGAFVILTRLGVLSHPDLHIPGREGGQRSTGGMGSISRYKNFSFVIRGNGFRNTLSSSLGSAENFKCSNVLLFHSPFKQPKSFVKSRKRLGGKK